MVRKNPKIKAETAAIVYTQWLPHVQVKVPDCPKARIYYCIRQKVIEFCQLLPLFLRQELDSFYTVADDNEYDLSPPVDNNIAQLLMLKVNKRELQTKNTRRYGRNLSRMARSIRRTTIFLS